MCLPLVFVSVVLELALYQRKLGHTKAILIVLLGLSDSYQTAIIAVSVELPIHLEYIAEIRGNYVALGLSIELPLAAVECSPNIRPFQRSLNRVSNCHILKALKPEYSQNVAEREDRFIVTRIL